MIVHIFPYEKFTQEYIKFIHDEFDIEEHIFLVYGHNDSYAICVNHMYNVYFLDKMDDIFNKQETYALVLQSSKIIFHFFKYKQHLYKQVKKIMHKSYLVFWGGDFYSLFERTDRPLFQQIKSNVKDAMKVYLIHRSKAVINLVEADYKVLQKRTLYHGKHFRGKYIANHDLRNQYIDHPKSDDPYLVLVGNSATPTNQHEDVIEWLSRYRDENVKFIFPLSYGNSAYREKIITLGHKKLGSSFEPLTDFMDYDSYMELLSKCCVGIFNNNRQQGMGNINAMVLYGAKTYLRTDTSMWTEFTTKRQTVHFDIMSIPFLSFEGFLQMEEPYKTHNKNKLLEASNREVTFELWTKIFND